MKSNTAHKTVIAAVAVLAALALPMVAGAADKLVVKAADGTTDAFAVTDTGSAFMAGKLGIGTISTIAPLHIKVSSTLSRDAAMKAEMVVTGTAPSASAAPNFTFLRNNEITIDGIVQPVSLPRRLDYLGSLLFGASGITAPSASITASAPSDWSVTNSPSQIFFMVNPGSVAGNASRKALTIQSTGTLQVNGGVQIAPYAAPGRPSCAVAVTGTIWFTKSTGAGVADKLEVCATTDGTNYSWKTIALQ